MDHVVLPIFWADKPALWFAQVEAVFALNRVTSDSDMYDHIVSELSNDVMSLVEDIILNPPEIEATHRYEYLKREVIVRMSIKQLKKENIGFMKPSEFLEHLQTKADSRVSKKTVKEIWIDGLPSHVKEVVKKEDCDNLDLLVIIADKVLGIHLVEKPSDSSSRDLEKKIDKLSQHIENLGKHVTDCYLLFVQIASREKLEGCKIGNNKTPEVKLKNNDQKVNQICWYHDNFGSRAVKCISPCHYKELQIIQKF